MREEREASEQKKHKLKKSKIAEDFDKEKKKKRNYENMSSSKTGEFSDTTTLVIFFRFECVLQSILIRLEPLSVVYAL